jgi:hypothetical protein
MFYLARTTLIIVGWLKGPLLRQFEKYGDDEPFYYPLPGLMVCLAIFAFFGGGLLAPVWRVWCLPFGPGLLFVFVAYYTWYERDRARKWPSIFMRYPHWQNTLRDYTTREERRRIAYRWRDLPLRTRLLLSSSDADFFRWADLVVMGTVS